MLFDVAYFINQSKNGSLWCKYWQDNVILKFFFLKRYVWEFLSKSYKISVMFVIPKVYSFLLRKNTLLRILHRKEHKVVPIVVKHGNR